MNKRIQAKLSRAKGAGARFIQMTTIEGEGGEEGGGAAPSDGTVVAKGEVVGAAGTEEQQQQAAAGTEQAGTSDVKAADSDPAAGEAKAVGDPPAGQQA